MIDIKLLRECIVAEIEYQLARQDRDSEGYTGPAIQERDVANAAWEKLTKAVADEGWSLSNIGEFLGSTVSYK